MPKIELPKIPGIDSDLFYSLEELKSKISKLKSSGELEKIGWESVGEGGESILLRKKDNPDLVIAYSFHPTSEQLSASNAIKIFWLNKMFHTIFPEHFRQIPFAIGRLNSSKKISESMQASLNMRRETDNYYRFGTLREYIELGTPTQKPINSFETVYNFLIAAKILDGEINSHENLDLMKDFFDAGHRLYMLSGNVGIDKNGQEKYLDTLDSWQTVLTSSMLPKIIQHEKEILEFMKEKNSTLLQIKTVQIAISRLKKL